MSEQHDDTVCAQCGIKLEETPGLGTLAFDGWCSQECKDDHYFPLHQDEGSWWFWTDAWKGKREGPFSNEHEARVELEIYERDFEFDDGGAANES